MRLRRLVPYVWPYCKVSLFKNLTIIFLNFVTDGYIIRFLYNGSFKHVQYIIYATPANISVPCLSYRSCKRLWTAWPVEKKHPSSRSYCLVERGRRWSVSYRLLSLSSHIRYIPVFTLLTYPMDCVQDKTVPCVPNGIEVKPLKAVTTFNPRYSLWKLYISYACLNTIYQPTKYVLVHNKCTSFIWRQILLKHKLIL